MPENPDAAPEPDTVRHGRVEPASVESERTLIGTLVAVICAAVATLFLLNPGWGLFAEIPDNLPVIGNLDEATATMILVSSLGYLGLRLPFLRRAAKAADRPDRDP